MNFDSYNSAECDFNKIVRRVVRKLKTAITASGSVITHDPLPCLAANPSAMVVVLEHLIQNAIKFRGSASGRIHISSKQKDNSWVFTVKDEGMALNPQETEQMFSIRDRLDSGVGLAISKRIIEDHGGRIWAESLPGAGAAFHFTIPE